MSSFPLAGEHSKIYHPTITNADLIYCAALVVHVGFFAGKKWQTFVRRDIVCAWFSQNWQTIVITMARGW